MFSDFSCQWFCQISIDLLQFHMPVITRENPNRQQIHQKTSSMRVISILLNANIPEEVSSGKKNDLFFMEGSMKFRRWWIKPNRFPCLCSLFATAIFRTFKNVAKLKKNFSYRENQTAEQNFVAKYFLKITISGTKLRSLA